MVDAPHLSLAAAILAAAAGARVVVHCGSTLGPKRGTTPADVLARARRPGAPRAGRVGRRCSTARTSRSSTPAPRSPAGTRSPPCATRSACAGRCTRAEKLVDHLGATHFVVGHTHSSYRERLQGALTLLGADARVTVRGMEGADILRTGRPSASDTRGPIELPETPGACCAATPTRRSRPR